MEFVIGLAIGLLIMFVILFPQLKVTRSRHRPIGDLRVDHSDPMDRPYLFLELDSGMDINKIIHNKYATFRVKVENFLPHE